MRHHTRSATRYTIPLALILAAAAVGGCASEKATPAYIAVTPAGAKQLKVTELQLASVDPTFRRDVASYSTYVEQAKALEGQMQQSAVLNAMGSLADAIEHVPNAPDLDLATAADRIRAPQPSSVLAFPSELDAIRANEQSLYAASTALGALAGGPYAYDKNVRTNVKHFQDDVRDLTESGQLSGRNKKLVNALEDGRKSLEAILAAAARRAG